MNVMRLSGYTPAIVLTVASLLLAPAGVHAGSTMSAEELRLELLRFMTLQQSYVEQYELLGGKSPDLAIDLQQQIARISLMPARDLEILAAAPIDLRLLNAELDDLLGVIQTQVAQQATADPAAKKSLPNIQLAGSLNGVDAVATAGAPQSADCPASGAFTSEADRKRMPPGFCAQSDDVPVYPNYANSPGSGVVTTYKLTDTDYHWSCPVNTAAGVLYGVELAFAAINGANHVLGKACQQEAAGFNSSTACTWVAPIMGTILVVLEDVGKCNGERRDAERNASYARAGEVYVQSDAHYAALESVNFMTSRALINLDTNIGGKLVKTGNEVSSELDNGFSSLGNQADAIEQQVLENNAKSASVRQNNDAIEYKIWCDQQRPDLRPSSCQ